MLRIHDCLIERRKGWNHNVIVPKRLTSEIHCESVESFYFGLDE